jgi:hypothetical protein
MCPVSFVRGAAVGDIFPLWTLSCINFLQNGPYFLVVLLFLYQRGYIPVKSGYGCCRSYLLDFLPTPWLNSCGYTLLSQKRLSALFIFWLTVLGSEVILLQALNPAYGLYFEVLITNEPGECKVVSTQMELLSIEIWFLSFELLGFSINQVSLGRCNRIL